MTASSGERMAWAKMMRLGLGVLRLPPETFWTMTPVEFRRALEGAGVLQPGNGNWMDRATLDRLMAQFPDDNKGNEG